MSLLNTINQIGKGVGSRIRKEFTPKNKTLSERIADTKKTMSLGLSIGKSLANFNPTYRKFNETKTKFSDWQAQNRANISPGGKWDTAFRNSPRAQLGADVTLGTLTGVSEGLGGYTGIDTWMGKRMFGDYERYEPKTTAGKVGEFGGGLAGFALGPVGKAVGSVEAAASSKVAPYLTNLPKYARGSLAGLAAESASSLGLGAAESLITKKPFTETFGTQLAGGLLGRGVFGLAGKTFKLGGAQVNFKGLVNGTSSEQPKVKAEAVEKLWGLLHSRNAAVKAGLLRPSESLSAAKTMELLKKKAPQLIPNFNNSKNIKSLKNTANTIINHDFNETFRNWVNLRRSTELSGVTINQRFKQFDSQGLEAIHDLQANKPGLEGARDYLDSIFKQLNDAGVTTRFKENYAPQIWNNTEEEVEQAFKSLNPSSRFSKKSVLINYKEGISKGLTPKFKTLSDLLGFYEKSARKSIADSQMLSYLRKNDLIKPASQADRGWVRIKAEGFPTNRVKSDSGEWISEPFAAPKEIAEKIDTYLNPAQIGGLEKFANYNTAVKNIRLAAGIPNTGINAHGWNILVRSTLSRNNPIGGFFDASKWILKPSWADNYVKSSMDKALKYSKAGMTMSTEDFAFSPDPKIIDGNVAKRAYAALGTTIDKYLGDPLFRKIIPALKIKYADEVTQGLVKSGVSEKEAVKQAAKTANNMFGGINELDRIFKSKDTQNALRSIILAPDWSESTVKTGYNIGKSLVQPTNPMLKPYRTFARNFMAIFIAAQVIDKAVGGEINDPFTMNAGYTEGGKQRQARIFGTGADMFRLPYEVVNDIRKGNFSSVGRVVGNRLSLGFGSILHLASNQDYRGRPILGKDKWGNPIPVGQQASNLTSELSNAVGVPSQATTLLDRVSGRIGNEEMASQLIEAPVRYSGGAYSPASQKKLDTYQAVGLKGEALYNAMRSKPKSNSQKEEGFFGWLKGLFSEESQEDSISNDPLVQLFNQEAVQDKKAARIREIFKDPVLNDSPELISKALEAEDLGSFEEASYLVAKSLGVENGNRGKYIQGILAPLQGREYAETVIELSKNKILTTSVISQWVEEGSVSEEQADQLKDLIKMAAGTYKPKTSKTNYKISLPGSLNLPTPKATTIKAPKIPSMNLAPIKSKKPTIKAPTYNQPSLRKQIESIRYRGARKLGDL